MKKKKKHNPQTKKKEYQVKKKLQEAFLEVFEKKACNITEACKAIGKDRGTYYKWLEDPVFQKQVEIKREALIDYAESTFYQKVFGIKNEDGTWRERPETTAQIFYLKCQGKRRGWIEKEEKVISGDRTGEPIRLIIEYGDGDGNKHSPSETL